jgi:hypothetical protein
MLAYKKDGSKFDAVRLGSGKDRSVAEKIVAVGLLTESDLLRLGSQFYRHVPIEHDELFADLIEQLDKVEATPAKDSITLSIKPRR